MDEEVKAKDGIQFKTGTWQIGKVTPGKVAPVTWKNKNKSKKWRKNLLGVWIGGRMATVNIERYRIKDKNILSGFSIPCNLCRTNVKIRDALRLHKTLQKCDSALTLQY